MSTKKDIYALFTIDKLLYLGRYCYFNTGQIGANSAFPHHWVCALDFNTGKEIYIDNSTLKKILSNDKKLLEDFKHENIFSKSFDEVHYKYLRLYSENHKNGINRK